MIIHDLIKILNYFIIKKENTAMIKVGILGTGFGKFHAELYKKINGFEVVSIFGRDTDKLKKIGEELNIHTTSNIDEIVQNSEIDLLDICLPTELHSKWAIEGLKTNKHIFCETPITYDLNEAEAIKKASQNYGKNVFVNLFIKFSTPHCYAIKIAKEGTLGTLVNMRSYNGTSPQWGDLGVKKNVETFHNHMIDFALEIAGKPEKVIASGMDFGGKSVVTATLKTGNIYTVLDSNSALHESSPFFIGFELVFANGMLLYDAAYGDDYTEEKLLLFQNGKPTETVNLDTKDDYEETFKHVLECIQNNTKSPVLDIDAAINMVRVKDMILASLDKNN
jgi:predicted dehydrogenase